jgi:hypothetical protein
MDTKRERDLALFLSISTEINKALAMSDSERFRVYGSDGFHLLVCRYQDLLADLGYRSPDYA